MLDLLALEPWWSRYETAWAAVKAADTAVELAGYSVHWISEVSIRNPLRLLPALAVAWRVIRAERPGVLISAGAGAAVPYFMVARLLGIPSFWIATFNVLTTPGISGTICARLASVVLLQRAATRARFPNGIVVGELY